MAKYCPQCRMDCGTGSCAMEGNVCKMCGKPPVDAADRNLDWLWCDQHREWHKEACSANATSHCCKKAA